MSFTVTFSRRTWYKRRNGIAEEWIPDQLDPETVVCAFAYVRDDCLTFALAARPTEVTRVPVDTLYAFVIEEVPDAGQ